MLLKKMFAILSLVPEKFREKLVTMYRTSELQYRMNNIYLRLQHFKLINSLIQVKKMGKHTSIYCFSVTAHNNVIN